MPFLRGLLILTLAVAIVTPLKLQFNSALLTSSTNPSQVVFLNTEAPTNQIVGEQLVLGAEKVATPSTTPTARPKVASKPSGLVFEILSALNSYRQKRGSPPLSLDGRLASFAKSRADTLAALGRLDNHAGFQSFISSGGFQKLGFNSLGENQSWASMMPSATNLIETQYAADKPHDDNQINPAWNYVGIGVSGNFTDLVFGTK